MAGFRRKPGMSISRITEQREDTDRRAASPETRPVRQSAMASWFGSAHLGDLQAGGERHGSQTSRNSHEGDARCNRGKSARSRDTHKPPPRHSWDHRNQRDDHIRHRQPPGEPLEAPLVVRCSTSVPGACGRPAASGDDRVWHSPIENPIVLLVGASMASSRLVRSGSCHAWATAVGSGHKAHEDPGCAFAVRP